MADDSEIDQEAARALVEAGYMPLEEYLNLRKQNGWEPQIPGDRDEPKRQAKPSRNTPRRSVLVPHEQATEQETAGVVCERAGCQTDVVR